MNGAVARVSGAASVGWAYRCFGPSGSLGEAWDTSRMAIVMVVVLCVFLLVL